LIRQIFDLPVPADLPEIGGAVDPVRRFPVMARKSGMKAVSVGLSQPGWPRAAERQWLTDGDRAESVWGGPGRGDCP
jgi:hypothetical protein